MATALVTTGIAVVVVPSPASAAPASRWLMVSAGWQHTCGIKVDTTLWCWGDGRQGEVGNGQLGRWDTPQEVGGTGWSVVSAGFNFTCGIRDGYRYCWGRNDQGQLGLRDTRNRHTPTRVSAENNNWETVSAGYTHACGFRRGGGPLQCWGRNRHGELGIGGREDRNRPTTVFTLVPKTWRSVSAGDDFTCAIDTDGYRFCWGKNTDGQLGLDKGPEDVTHPTQRPGEGTWVSLDTDIGSGCGVTGLLQGMYCWGEIAGGARKPTPVGGVFWMSIGVGHGFACGIQLSLTSLERDRSCWGVNGYGQLGLGTWTNQSSPQQVDDGPWASISVGRSHACGLSPNRYLYCWGSNAEYQLGLGIQLPSQFARPELVY